MRLPKRLLLAAGVAALAGRRALQVPYDLRGKRVLITGGSRGLGLALAREFGSRGARLALVARDGAELDRAAADLRGRGVEVSTFSADLTGPDLAALVADVTARLGGIDVLVHDAGVIQAGPFENQTEQDFRDAMELNAFAPLRLTRAALPQLQQSRGRVLIIASVGGKVAVPHLAAYSMSKFAVVGLGQGLRAELARHGIGVTTVCPGLMRTGSARHAVVKGQHEKEYGWFATAASSPVIALDAAEAARRIVNALVRGDAEAPVGGPALLLRSAQALAPQLTADALALANRFLPGPAATNAAKTGREAETPVTRNNPLKQSTEREFNELGDGEGNG